MTDLLINPIVADKYKLMITPKEQETFLLMQGAKAIHADLDSYYSLIMQVYAYKGMKTEGLEDELVKQATLFKAEVSTYFKSLSFEEVKLAIEQALRATVDRLEYPSIESYSLAIKRYVNSSETLNAKKAVLARLNPPQIVEATPIEKEKICQQGFERLKAKVAAGESIVYDPYSTGCYGWLKDKGVLNGIMTPEEIAETKQRAIDLLNAEFTTKANTLNKDQRSLYLKKAQDLIGGLLPNDLNAMCKKLALEKLIKEGRV